MVVILDFFLVFNNLALEFIDYRIHGMVKVGIVSLSKKFLALEVNRDLGTSATIFFFGVINH